MGNSYLFGLMGVGIDVSILVIICIVAAVAAAAVIASVISVIRCRRERRKGPSADVTENGPETAPAEEPVAEEPVAEEIVAEEPVAEPAPAEEPAEEPVPAGQAVGADEDEDEVVRVWSEATQSFILMRYVRSFTARVIQADDVTKGYYTELKAELLSYGMKSRTSWKHETFRRGRPLLVKMRMRGKTLCLYFALDPKEYAETKYKVEDVSDISSFADVPMLYRISNDRRCKYAKELIADVMAKHGFEKGEVPEVPTPPYETTEALLGRDLIREVEGGAAPAPAEKPAPVIETRQSVKAAEVDAILADEIAADMVEEAERFSDRTKTGIINIDTLEEYFEDGETVTLDEIQKRVPGYRKVTYIKVLARGTLDKKLTVEADDYSIEAVKMILLTGGKVLRTRVRND